jgi:hypothetical protein
VKTHNSKRRAIACAISIFSGSLIGAFAGACEVQTGATFSLLASIENEGRRTHSDLYRINISNDTYMICAETADASERMCSKGGIRIGRHHVHLLEQNFTRFSDGVPISKGPSAARWNFEVIFQSDEVIVIYNPLEGVFLLKKVV